MANKNEGIPRLGKFLTPTIADIFFVTLFFSIALGRAQALLGDCDTGYHIRAGEYIIQTLSIPHKDIFSFISPPMTWTAHEWLSEVIMAAIHSRFGLTGVTVFFSGLIALVYYLLARFLHRLNLNLFVSLIFIIMAISSSMVHWAARPHIFSLVMLVLWYNLLDTYQYRGKNYLFLLPISMLLWVNLHGGFIVGFILLAIYGAGNLVMSFFGEQTERVESRQRCWLIFKISLISLAASFVNPFGYRILLFPFNLVSNSYLMDRVSEFMTPNFHDFETFPFKLLLLSLLAITAGSRKRLNVIEIALLLFFINMALYSVRYITLFAIIVTPIAARLAEQLLDASKSKVSSWLRRKNDGFAAIDTQAKGWFWPIFAVIAMTILSVVKSGPVVTFDERVKPIAAVAFIQKEHIPGNMFNNDEFGDYIIYGAWPKYQVFFDGRSDMYGVDRLKEYEKISRFEFGWESVMKKYDMNWIIFDADSVLARYLYGRKDWRLIYADKIANIFVRDIPIYKALIKRYPRVKPVNPNGDAKGN
jgi:hypothetical protein